MEIQSNLVDLNTAEQVELRNVPGIGSKLADRIIAARPLSDLKDLRRVSGVGPALFEQLKPYVTVIPSAVPTSQVEVVSIAAGSSDYLIPAPPSEAAQPKTQPESLPAGDQPAVESEPLSLAAQPAAVDIAQPMVIATDLQAGDTGPGEPIPPPSAPEISGPASAVPGLPSIPPPPPPASPGTASLAQPPNRSVTRAELYGIAAASGVFSFILAVFFTLVFLGLINGGLRFVRPVEMNQLASRVNTIDTQASQLSGEIDSLKTRVSAVEGLDGRVTSVEQDTRQLRKDVDTLSGSAQTLGKRIDDLSFQVDALVTRTGRFQSFLDSLRNLLNNLNQPEVP